MDLKVFGATWLGVLGVLMTLSCVSRLVGFLATGVLAMVLADLALKTHDIYFTTRQQIRNVKGMAVLITGCDTGFGNQLAGRLARKGFKVYAGCLNPDSNGAQQLSANGHVKVIKLDVTNTEDIENAYKIVKDDLTKHELSLWSIINNAGIAILSETEFLTMKDLRFIFDVNTFGPVMITKTFLPLLRAAKGGRVVNVASQAGRVTACGYTPYSMSKHAAVAFTDGLRMEMKPFNISVHSIEPALYKTPIMDADHNRGRMMTEWDHATDEVKKAYGKQYFEAFVDAIVTASTKANRNVYEVIDDMEDAVMGLNPKIRYIPGNKTKRIVRLLRLLPQTVTDKFLTINLDQIVKPTTAP